MALPCSEKVISISMTITSILYGDNHRVNSLHLFRTKSKRQSHKNILRNHGCFQVKMTKCLTKY